MREPHAFNAESWTMPLKSGAKAKDASRIRIRMDGHPSKTWEVDEHSPSEELRENVKNLLIATGAQRFRMETLNGAGESIGSKIYILVEPFPMPEAQKTTSNDDTPIMAKSLDQLVTTLGNTVNRLVTHCESLGESLRKSRMEAPSFFVDLYRDSLKTIETLRNELQTTKSERDVLLVLLEKKKEGKGEEHSMVLALREVKDIFGKTPPSIAEMLKRMVEAVKAGKVQDLGALLANETNESRAQIVANVVLAGISVTKPEDRDEFVNNVMKKVQDAIAAAQAAQ